MRLVGTVGARTVADAMMRADPPQRPRQPGTGLFLQLSDDAVLDALAVLAGASGQQPHPAAIPAHDDVLADEADHMDVGHQLVSRKIGREGGIDASPLPALLGVEQWKAGRQRDLRARTHSRSLTRPSLAIVADDQHLALCPVEPSIRTCDLLLIRKWTRGWMQHGAAEVALPETFRYRPRVLAARRQPPTSVMVALSTRGTREPLGERGPSAAYRGQCAYDRTAAAHPMRQKRA